MQPKITRPFLLKILVVIFLALSWFGWWRLYGAVSYASFLSAYLSDAMLVYLGVSGALWGLAGVAAAILLWVGIPIAPIFSRAAAAGCFIWYWLDRLFLSQSSLSKTNQLFVLMVSLAALAFAFFVPALPRSRRFFAGKKIVRGE